MNKLKTRHFLRIENFLSINNNNRRNYLQPVVFIQRCMIIFAILLCYFHVRSEDVDCEYVYIQYAHT